MPPKKPSLGEETMALHFRLHGLHPEREFRFASGRKYAADFGFPSHMLLVEVEGGIWTGGRHTRGSSFEADTRKYNLATLLGYRVLRYSTAMVQSGEAIGDILKIMGVAS